MQLSTPDIELGSDFTAGRTLLGKFGHIEESRDDTDGLFVRVDSARFSIAIYERSGRVGAVWYDDPAGRDSAQGRDRKIAAYLKRYMVLGSWKQTMDNGWMIYWFNEVDDRLAVYGIHNDVLRINDRKL